jgi:serine/threonine protein kinase
MLIGTKDRTNLKSSRIVLIDFGLAKPFRDGSGKHLECKDIREFKGNFLFSSHNAFRYENLSRRDDLISLGNLLVYLLLGDTPWSN